MFIEERHQAILDLLAKNGSILNSEIQEKFDVSYDSAKRDLRILEEKGLLKRTHGGAIPIRQIGSGGECHDLSAKERVPYIKDNYLAIAKKAVSLIKNKDVVYFCPASIGYLMTQNIPNDLECTVVTNSISIADELRTKEKITTIVTGGEISANGNFYDSFTIETLNRFRFDKCFITSSAISADFGLSIQKTRNIGLINSVIANSKQAIGLYPTGKIGFNSIVSICPSSCINTLITDWDASEEDLKKFDEQGIEVIVVDKQEQPLMTE